jgi:hypothetical protein
MNSTSQVVALSCTDRWIALSILGLSPTAICFAERWNLNLIGEAFNIFNVTNILGVSNLNYSGFANTLTPDQANPSFSSSFGMPVTTAGGVFGSGGPRALPVCRAPELLGRTWNIPPHSRPLLA